MPPGLIFKLEVSAAAVLTLLALFFRFVFATHAGALWRDEANTVFLATMSSLGEMWNHLQYDSFPIAWPIVLRAISGMGISSDLELRLFGLVLGSLLIAGLWLHCRAFSYRTPLVSLAIFGISPCVISWGSTMRAYGFGMITVVFFIPLLWKFIHSGKRSWFAAALFVSLLCVHTIYYNAVIIFGCSIGGVAVLVRRRLWKRMSALLTLGAISAASLFPYLGPIGSAGEWNMLCQVESAAGLDLFVRLSETLDPAGAVAIWMWTATILLALGLSLSLLLPASSKSLDLSDSDSLMFATVSLLVGAVCYYVFLSVLRYPTQPWYYLILLALVASTTDTILGIGARRRNWVAWSRMILALIVVTTTFGPVLKFVKTRLTNIDLVSDKLRNIAGERDLIVVNPWYVAVSFSRYYRGRASWEGIPKSDLLRLHRYDVIKAAMMLPNQAEAIAPNLASIADTLKAGGKVFVIGGLRFLQKNESPLLLPPAPTSRYKWQDGAYYLAWSSQVAAYIQQHARSLSMIEVPVRQMVNPFEDLPLIVIQGWSE